MESKICENYRYIDMHCDTLMKAFFSKHSDIYSVPELMFDFERFRNTGGMVQFTAIFFPPGNSSRTMDMPDDMQYFHETQRIFENTISQHSREISKIKSASDLLELESSEKTGALLTMEDGRAVDGSFDRLEYFFEHDVRLISLTWNFENCFGFPNSKNSSVMEMGLKPFGKQAVEYMNKKGMIVDVSHLSDGGFYDVAEISKRPFVASHSNCRAVTDHPRNLTDEMIGILGNSGGVMGLNFAPEFVCEDSANPISTAEYLAKHARHAANVGGVDVVAVGSDFDGIHGEIEISSVDRTELLWTALARAGFTESEIEKIAFKNAARVLREVLP